MASTCGSLAGAVDFDAGLVGVWADTNCADNKKVKKINWNNFIFLKAVAKIIIIFEFSFK
jgi:hypothetical protein